MGGYAAEALVRKTDRGLQAEHRQECMRPHTCVKTAADMIMAGKELEAGLDMKVHGLEEFKCWNMFNVFWEWGM